MGHHLVTHAFSLCVRKVRKRGSPRHQFVGREASEREGVPWIRGSRSYPRCAWVTKSPTLPLCISRIVLRKGGRWVCNLWWGRPVGSHSDRGATISPHSLCEQP